MGQERSGIQQYSSTRITKKCTAAGEGSQHARRVGPLLWWWGTPISRGGPDHTVITRRGGHLFPRLWSSQQQSPVVWWSSPGIRHVYTRRPVSQVQGPCTTDCGLMMFSPHPYFRETSPIIMNNGVLAALSYSYTRIRYE